jgi:hypothetical protein
MVKEYYDKVKWEWNNKYFSNKIRK